MNRTTRCTIIAVTAALLLAPLASLHAAASPLRDAATAPARSAVAGLPLPRLKVSDNHRFLVTADGKPFFWMADTAWELFHRLNREEAERYLANRPTRASPSSRPWRWPNWTG